METSIPLLPMIRRYFESDPAGAAHSLETMDKNEAVSVLNALPPSLVAQAFRYLQPRYSANL